MDYNRARDQLKGELRNYVESITKKSKGSNMYVCPLCHSGEGRKGTGAFSIKDETSWKCFSCNEGGDIFDLIGKYEDIPDHADQLRRACDLFGITLDSSGDRYQYTHNSIHTSAQPQETDFSDFFIEAHSHIRETDYPQKRGLSQETIDRFKLGFIPEWRHPKAPASAQPTPRLIIPISRYSYLARDTRSVIPDDQSDYKKSKVKGRDKASWTFNAKALQTAERPIFVVEGELDALSIIEAGGEAIALGSISYIRAFLELVRVKKPAQPLILALDNETEQKKQDLIAKAYSELEGGLRELDIPFYRMNPAGDYHDANDALTADREAFRQAVEDGEHIQDEAEQAEREAYLATSTASYIQGFIDDIADSVNTPYIPTGFTALDKALDGGLFEGLYIVGAISSLGKTTMITQIADQIAQSGKDVLIFSLEMARTEIMAKSISRHTLQIVMDTGGDVHNAKTTRGITTGARYAEYSHAEKELIKTAIKRYSEYASHIYISEGIGEIGADRIRETIQRHIHFTGNTPVVFIDYLQILAPAEPRATDKQNTDKAVMELKRISRDFKTPVIGISSFNRASYREAVTMEAFKESGAIEYSSDVLVGLQVKGAGDKSFDSNEAKKKNPREVELVILKNRNGRTGDKIEYRYYPLFNFFEET